MCPWPFTNIVATDVFMTLLSRILLPSEDIGVLGVSLRTGVRIKAPWARTKVITNPRQIESLSTFYYELRTQKQCAPRNKELWGLSELGVLYMMGLHWQLKVWVRVSLDDHS